MHICQNSLLLWLLQQLVNVPVEPEPDPAGADAGVQTGSGQGWRAYSAVEELQPKSKTGFDQMIFLLCEDKSQSES